MEIKSKFIGQYYEFIRGNDVTPWREMPDFRPSSSSLDFGREQ